MASDTTQLDMFGGAGTSGSALVKYKPTDSFAEVGAAGNIKTRATRRMRGDYSSILGERNNPLELARQFRENALIKRIVTAPVNDALARGRTWEAADSTQEERDKIDAHMTELGMMEKTREGLIASRLFGGAAVLIGTKDTDLSEPIDVDRMDLGSITYLTLISRYDFRDIDIDEISSSPTHGEATMFYLNTTSASYNRIRSDGGTKEGEVKINAIHPSRLVIFRCERRMMPRGTVTMLNYWGDGAIRSCLNAVLSLTKQYATLEVLMDEVKTPTLKYPSEGEGFRDDAERQAFTDDLTHFNNNKNLLNLNVIPVGWEYDLNEFKFVGVKDVTDSLMTQVSTDANIPRNILFGEQETSIFADASDGRSKYHERLQTDQNSYITPPLRLLDLLIVRSALGRAVATQRPYVPVWNSLTELTPADKTAQFTRGVEAIVKLTGNPNVKPEQIERLTEIVIANSGIGEN